MCDVTQRHVSRHAAPLPVRERPSPQRRHTTPPPRAAQDPRRGYERLASYDALESWVRGFEALATSRHAALPSWLAALWALDDPPPPAPDPRSPHADYSLAPDRATPQGPPAGAFVVRAPRHPLAAAVAYALLWCRVAPHRTPTAGLEVRRDGGGREVIVAVAPEVFGAAESGRRAPAGLLLRTLRALLGPQPLLHCDDAALARLLQVVRPLWPPARALPQ